MSKNDAIDRIVLLMSDMDTARLWSLIGQIVSALILSSSEDEVSSIVKRVEFMAGIAKKE